MVCNVREAPAVAHELDCALAHLELDVGSTSAAVKLASAYVELVDRLGKYPLMYPLCAQERLSAKGYRKASLSGTSYLAVYSVSGDVVTILHLFHQRSDYARYL